MLKKTAVIVFCLAMSALAFYIYQSQQLPDGVEPMSGQSSETVAWLALATSIVTLLVAIVGLIQKVIELRMTKQ